MQWLMLSYADGSDEIRAAGNRILHQAKSAEVFSECKVLNDLDLLELVSEPAEYFNFISSHPRGHGLWSWKSLVISKAVDGYYGDFDGIFYTDAGSELVFNAVSRKKVLKMMECAMNNGIFGFTTNSSEIQYSKKLVLDMLIDPNEAFTPQREATTLLISAKSANARSIIDSWKDLSFKDHFELLKDSECSDEDPAFIDHRHDQSVLSVLLKNSKIPGNKLNTPNHSQHSIPLLDKIVFTPWPIWQVRNRSGVSLVADWQKSPILSRLCVPFFLCRHLIYRLTRMKNRMLFWSIKIKGKWKN